MWFSSSQSWVPMIPLLSSIVGILMTYTGFCGQSWIPILTVMASDIGIILTLSHPLVSTQYFSKSLQWKKRKCQSWPLLLMLPKSWTPMILLLALRIQGHMKSQLWKIGNSKSWLHLLPILTAVAFGIGMFLILIGWIPMAMLSFAFGILLALIDCATKSVKKTSIQSRGKNQWQKIRPLSTTCFIWKNKSRVLVHFSCQARVHTKHKNVFILCSRSFCYFNYIVVLYYLWSIQPLLIEMVKLNHCCC